MPTLCQRCQNHTNYYANLQNKAVKQATQWRVKPPRKTASKEVRQTTKAIVKQNPPPSKIHPAQKVEAKHKQTGNNSSDIL
ncbi:hypothetical protein [Helicobacter sp.]|uniref:hypothetical protein n=1 Tax=Helicobacter sp. TaxID=218 RepID=UPI00388D296E